MNASSTDSSIMAERTTTDFVLSLNDSLGHAPGKVWMSTVPLVLTVIIAITIVGNILVVVAFARDARIRSTVANFFILNLAVTDLLVGSTLMTTYLAQLAAGQWNFGETFCKIFSTVDFTLTFMSTLTMLLISWDRYCLLTMGMAYKTYQTRKRIGITLIICWVACLLFYATLAFGWESMFGKSSIDFSVECEMEFLTNLKATVVVNVIEFVIPFSVLLVLNLLVYLKIKGRSLRAVGPSPGNPMQGNSAVQNETSTASIRMEIRVMEGSRIIADTSTVQLNQRTLKGPHKQEPTEGCRGREGDLHGSTPAPRRENVTNRMHGSGYVKAHASKGITEVRAVTTSVTNTGEAQQKDRTPVNKAKRIMAKHRKAAVVLTILSGCYFLCYLPYNIYSTIYAICNFECTNDLIWEITAYLLWCNSTINPFIYAATNVHFRRNFRHFLFIDRWSCDLKGCKVKRHHGGHDNSSLADTEYDTQQ